MYKNHRVKMFRILDFSTILINTYGEREIVLKDPNPAV